MNTKRKILGSVALGLLVVATIALLSRSEKREPSPPPLAEITEDQKAELLSFWQREGLPPEDYIIAKFKQHDVILLGEFHRLGQDPLFVQRMIPILQKNGVRLLGFEFVLVDDQPRIDRLVSAKSYDERLAIDILRHPAGDWPWQEYLDVFKAAWSLNASLAADAERFRVIGLAPFIDWEKLNYGTVEERRQEWRRMVPNDQVHAEVIEQVALAEGKKMLVYCGLNHAFSRFRQPILDQNYQFTGSYTEERAGQLLRAKYPDKVITLILHAPFWYPSHETWGLPFGGIVDQTFAAYWKPVGFDVSGSPFGGLEDAGSVYSVGYGKIRLSDFCDGYVVLTPVEDYRGVTVIPTWFEGVSFSQYKRRLPKKLPFFVVFHPRILLWAMKDGDGNWPQRFKPLVAQLEEQQEKESVRP